MEEDWEKELPAWVREKRPLDEAGWLAEFRLTFVLDYLDAQEMYDRRLLLFACACCRRVWDLLTVDAARRIVELAEAYADGEATEAEVLAASTSSAFAELEAVCGERESEDEVQLSACVIDALQSARRLALPPRELDSYLFVQDTSQDRAKDFMRTSIDYQIGRGPLTDQAELAVKERILRDIFGNPFRPVAFKPEWRTPTVLSLARLMYGSRDFSPMPILGDALQDAGCADETILGHCTGEGLHVRGCWALDLVLGKE